MMHDSQLLWIRVVDVQHIFQPIGTIWHAHIHPICLLILHAAVPDLAESQDISVEGVGFGAVLDHNTEVKNVLRDTLFRKISIEVTAMERSGHELDEFYIVA